MALLLAEERFLKIKQAVEEEQNQPEVMQELLLKLMNDLQILNGIQPKQAEQEEPAAQSFLLNWNFPMADDDEYTIIYRKPKAITPDLPIEEPDNSLNDDEEYIIAITPVLPTEEPDNFIESLNDNLTPDCVLKSPSTFPIPVEDSDSFFKKSDNSLSYLDNSLPEFETFSDHTEKTSSGSTTTHADNSLLEYDSFLFETEPDQGELTSVVMKDILGEPRMPNVLPTHPTLYLDSDFAPSDDSLEPDLVVSFPSGTRNKIFDPGIFIEVQSKRFLSPNEFSISFTRDPLSTVFDTLLPFSSINEEKVFNPGSLSSNEEKSPHPLSHWGFNPSKIISNFSKSLMMISGGDIPILDVPFLHFYPP
ncbi:hypothetical protein Tco_1173423 [Tanacetum coccineum]